MTTVTATTPTYIRWTLRLILALLFALPCVIGRNVTYLILLAGLVAIITPSVFAARREASRTSVDLAFVVIFVALAVTFVITARDARDLSYILNFSPFLLAVPFRWQLEREARADGAAIIGWLSLAGTFGAAGLAIWQIGVLQYSRVGQPHMNTFYYADTTMLLGFMALVGWFAPGVRNRWPFLLGPLVGIASVIASGTRGALLAAPVLVLVAFAFALATSKRKGLILLLAGGALVVLIGAIGVSALLGNDRALEAFSFGLRLLSGGQVDDSTLQRVQMLIGGWHAFLASPLYGHGWGGMVPAIYPYVDPAYEPAMHGFRHLHNGFISFAASAGIVGAVSFIVLSVLPIVGVLASRRDAQFVSRLYLAVTMCAGYFVFQLTFLLIGFDFHTMQYAYMTMVILAFVRDPGQSAAGNSAVGSETTKAV